MAEHRKMKVCICGGEAFCKDAINWQCMA